MKASEDQLNLLQKRQYYSIHLFKVTNSLYRFRPKKRKVNRKSLSNKHLLAQSQE